MTTRITDKDFFTMVRDIALDTADLPIDNSVVVEWAEKKLAQIEKKKATAAKRAAEKKAEADPLTNAVLAVLTDEFQTLADIAEQVDMPEVTVGKISYRLNALTESKTDNPQVEKGEIVIKEEGSRARHLTGYKKIG